MEQPEAKSKGGPWSRLTMPQAAVLAALIIAAALMLSDRYAFQAEDTDITDIAWRFDQLTGEVTRCYASGGRNNDGPHCEPSDRAPPPAE
jgi:hypothetical protein